MNREELIQEYRKIKSQYSSADSFQELLNNGFAFQYDEDEAECELLFLGMNPSSGHIQEEEIAIWDRAMTESKDYFKPFFSIQDSLRKTYDKEVKWTHFDLFVFRKTKQSFIKNTLMRNEVSREFLFKQLEIIKSRLLKAKPKVIVASNALIRTFLGMDKMKDKKTGLYVGVWLGGWIKFEFDKKIGTYIITEPIELKGTIIFFTSMLSGQRALDLGTRERLTWHIAQVLK
ncbi:hypothetical protein [Myroides odoratimimus]|uniref:hypothetical protein n=1 Tax=Myroides odoratimimus TaxID=76832 RepID=UPI002575F864|nr:hypothetical protein [Myroides odoratimimus]MDM1512622.1 hypothetical protein [Myroides odoratimimus]